MKKKTALKQTKLDENVIAKHGLNKSSYTLKELELAHRLEAEIFTRMEYERFVCWLCKQCQMFTRSFAISEKIVLNKKANLTPKQVKALLNGGRK